MLVRTKDAQCFIGGGKRVREKVAKEEANHLRKVRAKAKEKRVKERGREMPALSTKPSLLAKRIRNGVMNIRVHRRGLMHLPYIGLIRSTTLSTR